MSSSANQPVWLGSSVGSSSRAHVEEAEPGRAEQVLDRAAGDEVDAERVRVEVDRADRLVRVGEAERARLVRDPRDLGDVVAVAGAVRDGRAADERRPLVDRLGEALGRDRAVGLGRDVDDLGAAQLLRMRDLADGRELVLADHDLRARLQVERETIPLTPCVTEVVTASSVGSACSSRAKAARAASARSTQCCPLGAVLVPAVEPALDRVLDAVRERPLRARVQVGRVREDRELGPDRRSRRARNLNGQGMPSASPHLAEDRPPCPPAPAARSRARSRGRRSRARHSRSARRRGSRRRSRAPP